MFCNASKNPFTRSVSASCLFALTLCVPVRAQPLWTHLARGPDHVSTTPALPQSLEPPAWVRSETATQIPIWYVGQAGVVADARHVFSLAEIDNQYNLLAMDRTTGLTSFSSPIARPIFSSWSTPAIDTSNNAVIVASGSELAAFDAQTGARLWTTLLTNPIVNASPTLTTDLGPADRVFITDYDGFGSAASLYCINIDPHDPALNPFVPGEIVWAVNIGPSTGNTPAYENKVVYTATAGTATTPNGQVLAFRADAISPPPPLWIFTNPKPIGFEGGVSVRTIGAQTSLYAASYSFSGALNSGNLVKVDAATGTLLWTADANRTASIPVPLNNNHIILAGGIMGFGSAPSLELFTDLGTSARLEWNSATDTWADLNNNGLMEPGEFLLVGGWSTQPVTTETGEVLVGALPTSGLLSEPCTDLYVLDTTRRPSDPSFVRDAYNGAGSTPAVVDQTIFSVGPAGLHAFDFGPACYADCDTSTGPGRLDIFDFLCFQFAFVAFDPYACDCDTTTGLGLCDIFDFLCFQGHFVGGCP
jgi:outer membrane protein assembly factor BamB